MIDIRKIIKNGNLRGNLMYGLSFLPDSWYVSLFYFAVNGKLPNLRNPKGYNEKLQWLKLHDKHPEYSVLVDKLQVREVIREKCGDEYLFPVLGSWDRFDDIDFSTLPNSFVLKCNHDSGSVTIIKDKSALTEKEMDEIRKKYDRRISHNFFYAGREYPYKQVKPKIFAEKMMVDSDGCEKGIKDYKFLCFNGVPKVMFTVSGRQTEKHEDYFDMEYNRLDITNGSFPSPVCPEKPLAFEKMKEMAEMLSQGIKQVRMDFYEIDGKPYFGEFTFFSGGGFELFHPEEWEYRLGEWIEL